MRFRKLQLSLEFLWLAMVYINNYIYFNELPYSVYRFSLITDKYLWLQN